MSMPDTHRLSLPGRSKPYVMAHRGNRGLFAENTLAAFRQALQDGADILETDLHLSGDEEFVCIHDGTVDRTTNGQGAVAEMSLAQLKGLNAAAARPDLSPESIPTLAEVVTILPHDRALALELKTDRFLEPHTCRRLADELEQAGIRARVVALSFSAARLQALKQAAPDIPVGLITISRVWPYPGVDLLGPFWPLTIANPLYTLVAHRRGQLVCPLDPNPSTQLLRHYRLLGSDAVITDNPQVTIRRLGK